jgi:hypothetical protein
MPEVKSFADLIRDWEKLLAACTDNAVTLGTAEPQRLVLEGLLARGREMKNRQDSLVAQKQLATQDLEVLKDQGREAARRLRGAVRSIVGSRSELLVQFNMFPLRPRRARKPAPVKLPQPPAEAKPETTTQ